MKKRDGFTLLELLVVIAIVGIMSVTAMPLYRTYQQRAYGSEAAVMLKRILDAQIIYFLENETFFPNGSTIFISHSDQSTNQAITDIKNALKLTIPVGHFLDYSITADALTCVVIISSPANNQFALFKDGSPSITGTVDTTGKIDTF